MSCILMYNNSLYIKQFSIKKYYADTYRRGQFSVVRKEFNEAAYRPLLSLSSSNARPISTKSTHFWMMV